MDTKLDTRELSTVLAAMRYWQRMHLGNGNSCPEDVIADNHKEFEAMDSGSIDALCQRINYGCEADKSF